MNYLKLEKIIKFYGVKSIPLIPPPKKIKSKFIQHFLIKLNDE